MAAYALFRRADASVAQLAPIEGFAPDRASVLQMPTAFLIGAAFKSDEPPILPSDQAILSVRHVTTYRYKRPISLGQHRLMMRPRDGHDQRLLDWQLIVEPRPTRMRWLYDALDNCVALTSFVGETTVLSVENRFTVERWADDVLGGEIDPRAQN